MARTSPNIPFAINCWGKYRLGGVSQKMGCAKTVSERIAIAAVLICLITVLNACGARNTALTDAEAAAITAISGVGAAGFSDISKEVLTKDITAKFPAVVKVFGHENLYAFRVKPV